MGPYRHLSIEERCEIARSPVPGGAAVYGKSLQLWIRAIDGGSGVEAQWVTIRRVPISGARTGQGTALDGGAARTRRRSARLRPRTWGVVRASRPPGRSGRADGDLLREYLPVHLRRRPGTRTTPGGAICHGRSGSAADGGAREAVRPPSSRTADRSPNAPRAAADRHDLWALGGGSSAVWEVPGEVVLALQSASRASCSARAPSKGRGRSPRPSPGCPCPRRASGPFQWDPPPHELSQSLHTRGRRGESERGAASCPRKGPSPFTETLALP